MRSPAVDDSGNKNITAMTKMPIPLASLPAMNESESSTSLDGLSTTHPLTPLIPDHSAPGTPPKAPSNVGEGTLVPATPRLRICGRLVKGRRVRESEPHDDCRPAPAFEN